MPLMPADVVEKAQSEVLALGRVMISQRSNIT
jgi:hypothetical protein